MKLTKFTVIYVDLSDNTYGKAYLEALTQASLPTALHDKYPYAQYKVIAAILGHRDVVVKQPDQ